MNIKDKIQAEAARRYKLYHDGNSVGDYHAQKDRLIFIAGAEWLDSEIVQPLIKENEKWKKKATLMEKYAGEWQDKFNTNEAMLQSQLSLSQGEIKGLRDKLYDSLPAGEVDAFELIKIIKTHINELDILTH